MGAVPHQLSSHLARQLSLGDRVIGPLVAADHCALDEPRRTPRPKGSTSMLSLNTSISPAVCKYMRYKSVPRQRVLRSSGDQKVLLIEVLIIKVPIIEVLREHIVTRALSLHLLGHKQVAVLRV